MRVPISALLAIALQFLWFLTLPVPFWCTALHGQETQILSRDSQTVGFQFNKLGSVHHSSQLPVGDMTTCLPLHVVLLAKRSLRC